MTVKQSNAYNWQYAGVTLVVGLIVSGLLLIPLIGAIAAPIIGAVIATRAMHQLYLEDRDRDWVFERYIEKEKKGKKAKGV